jgi:phage/plasmid primase-like uncharacterized protein
MPDGRWAEVPVPAESTPAELSPGDRLADAPPPMAEASPPTPPAASERQEGRPMPRPEAELQAEFAAELSRIGLRLPGVPVMDGQKHPVPVEGNRGSHKSGFYRADHGHGFGMNSRTGQTVTWHAQGAGQPLNEAQREADRDARIARQQAREARERATAEQARQIWAGASPASPRHPYLVRKEIGPEGLRQGAPGQMAAYRQDDGRTMRMPITGKLVVPMRDADGHLHNLQFIDPTGGKMFLQGRKKGLMTSLGDRTAPDQPLLIAEGVATAATLHSTTALTTIVAFDAGNLAPVAEAIRQKQPARPIIIAADNDRHAPRRTPPLPNVGLEKARAAAEQVGGIVIAPPFEPGEKGTDWNDFAARFSRETRRAEGRAAIERQLGDLKLPPLPSVNSPGPAAEPKLDLSRYQQARITRDLAQVPARIAWERQQAGRVIQVSVPRYRGPTMGR